MDEKLKTRSLYDIVLAALIAAAVVMQGSYFPAQYTGIVFFLGILVLYALMVLKKAVTINFFTAVPITLIGLFYILSALFSAVNKYSAFIETLKMFCFILPFIAGYFQNNRNTVLKGVFAGCFLLCAAGILSYIDLFPFPKAVLNDGKSVRMQSLVQYANVTALLCGVGFFIAFYFKSTAKKLADRIKYHIYSFVMLVGIVLTLSRGAIIIFSAVLLLWLIMLRSSRDAAQVIMSAFLAFAAAYLMNLLAVKANTGMATLVLCAFLCASALMYFLVEKFEKRIARLYPALIILPGVGAAAFALVGTGGLERIFRINLTEGTLVERFIYLTDSLKVIMDKPLLGIGPDNWQSQQFMYQTAQYYTHYVHCGFIQIALDAGIIALAGLLSVIAFFYIRAIKSLKASGDAYFAALIAMVTFILVHSLIDVGFSFGAVLMILAVLISSVLKDYRPSRNISIAYIFKTASFASLILLCLVSLYIFTGRVLYDSAEGLYSRGDFSNASGIYNISRFLRPFDGDVFVRMAVCCQNSGRTDLAEQYLNRAVALDCFRPEYLYEKASFEMTMEKYNNAYNTATQLIKAKPLGTEGYAIASDAAHKLYRNRTISRHDFNGKMKEIEGSMRIASKTINPLSKYLRNQVALDMNSLRENESTLTK